MRLKYPQNGIRLSPKPTPKNKRNKTKEKHKKGGHLQRKNNPTSLGNKANKRVSILDMLREAALSVKAKTMRTRGISNRRGTQRGSHAQKKKKKRLHPKPLRSKSPSSPPHPHPTKKGKKKRKDQKKEGGGMKTFLLL